MAENTVYVLTKTQHEDGAKQRTFRLSYDATTITAADYTQLNVGFKPKYIVVENFTDSTKFEWYDSLTQTVSGGSFVVGTLYKIASVGTTDFTLVGAPNNTVGTEFVATGVGAGSGTAVTNDNICIKTASTGARTIVTATASFLVRDKAVQLSQNATTAMILASKNLSVMAVG